jgi:succinate dehydrogenase/fumarate reductase flavoprotein subunit
MTTSVDKIDLLVIGGGMAGMSAAGYLASRGGAVFVVEKSAEIGGSAALSGGKIWGSPSLDQLRREDPEGDADLAAVLIEDFPETLAWVRHGADVGEQIPILGWGTGYNFDILGYLDQCRRLVEGAGGGVLRNTSVTELLQEDGRVLGARIRDRDGNWEIWAEHTLLATGGFQADPELRSRYIHPQAASMLLRSNPSSSGDGLRLGLSVGGVQNPHHTGFYGHLMCAPLDELRSGDFARLSQYHSDECLVFNLEGRRFCDETLRDHSTAEFLVAEPGMRGLLVSDHDTYLTKATVPPAAGMEALDKFAEAEIEGANTARVENIDDIAAVADSWGFAGTAVVSEIRRFNAWCDDRSIGLAPPRQRNRRQLGTGPFHVMEVAPAITFTYGGLVIDRDARVLNESRKPIPGLLAAGADGCPYVWGYAGGLGMSAVFGRRAARTALGEV